MLFVSNYRQVAGNKQTGLLDTVPCMRCATASLHLEAQPIMPSPALHACSIADVANSPDFKAQIDVLSSFGEDVGKPAGSTKA